MALRPGTGTIFQTLLGCPPAQASGITFPLHEGYPACLLGKNLGLPRLSWGSRHQPFGSGQTAGAVKVALQMPGRECLLSLPTVLPKSSLSSCLHMTPSRDQPNQALNPSSATLPSKSPAPPSLDWVHSAEEASGWLNPRHGLSEAYAS